MGPIVLMVSTGLLNGCLIVHVCVLIHQQYLLTSSLRVIAVLCSHLHLAVRATNVYGSISYHYNWIRSNACRMSGVGQVSLGCFSTPSPTVPPTAAPTPLMIVPATPQPVVVTAAPVTAAPITPAPVETPTVERNNRLGPLTTTGALASLRGNRNEN